MSTMQQQHVWVSRTVKDACRHVLLMGEGGGWEAQESTGSVQAELPISFIVMASPCGASDNRTALNRSRGITAHGCIG